MEFASHIDLQKVTVRKPRYVARGNPSLLTVRLVFAQPSDVAPLDTILATIEMEEAVVLLYEAGVLSNFHSKYDLSRVQSRVSRLYMTA